MPAHLLDSGEAALAFTLDIAAVMEEVNGVPEGMVKARPESENGGKPPHLRFGGEVQASKLIHKVMPVYPAGAKAAGVQGTVILHAVIGMEGRPLSLRVMNNDSAPELARAAIEAVSQWRYRPTLLNGARNRHDDYGEFFFGVVSVERS
jgi:TonB family protein